MQILNVFVLYSIPLLILNTLRLAIYVTLGKVIIICLNSNSPKSSVDNNFLRSIIKFYLKII